MSSPPTPTGDKVPVRQALRDFNAIEFGKPSKRNNLSTSSNENTPTKCPIGSDTSGAATSNGLPDIVTTLHDKGNLSNDSFDELLADLQSLNVTETPVNKSLLSVDPPLDSHTSSDDEAFLECNSSVDESVMLGDTVYHEDLHGILNETELLNATVTTPSDTPDFVDTHSAPSDETFGNSTVSLGDQTLSLSGEVDTTLEIANTTVALADRTVCLSEDNSEHYDNTVVHDTQVLADTVIGVNNPTSSPTLNDIATLADEIQSEADNTEVIQTGESDQPPYKYNSNKPQSSNDTLSNHGLKEMALEKESCVHSNMTAEISENGNACHEESLNMVEVSAPIKTNIETDDNGNGSKIAVLTNSQNMVSELAEHLNGTFDGHPFTGETDDNGNGSLIADSQQIVSEFQDNQNATPGVQPCTDDIDNNGNGSYIADSENATNISLKSEEHLNATFEGQSFLSTEAHEHGIQVGNSNIDSNMAETIPVEESNTAPNDILQETVPEPYENVNSIHSTVPLSFDEMPVGRKNHNPNDIPEFLIHPSVIGNRANSGNLNDTVDMTDLSDVADIVNVNFEITETSNLNSGAQNITQDWDPSNVESMDVDVSMSSNTETPDGEGFEASSQIIQQTENELKLPDTVTSVVAEHSHGFDHEVPTQSIAEPDMNSQIIIPNQTTHEELSHLSQHRSPENNIFDRTQPESAANISSPTSNIPSLLDNASPAVQTQSATDKTQVIGTIDNTPVPVVDNFNIPHSSSAFLNHTVDESASPTSNQTFVQLKSTPINPRHCPKVISPLIAMADPEVLFGCNQSPITANTIDYSAFAELTSSNPITYQLKGDDASSPTTFNKTVEFSSPDPESPISGAHRQVSLLTRSSTFEQEEDDNYNESHFQMTDSDTTANQLSPPMASVSGSRDDGMFKMPALPVSMLPEPFGGTLSATSSVSSLPDQFSEQFGMGRIPETADDAQFNCMTFQSSDFDFLLSKGSNSSDLPDSRDSVLLRFDPLLGRNVLVNQLVSQPIPEEHSAASPGTSRSSMQVNGLLDRQSNIRQRQTTSPSNQVAQDLGEFLNTAPVKQVPVVLKQDFGGRTVKRTTSGQATAANATMSVGLIQDIKTECDVKPFVSANNMEHNDHSDLPTVELERKIKVELLKSEDAEKKLKEAELREESLIRRISEKDKAITKMNGVMEQYEKAISELVSEKEQIINGYEAKNADLRSDRDANFQHLSSLETTFSDLHAKYERSKQLTSQLKECEDALKAENDKLSETLSQQEQRYEKMKNHAIQQLDIANNKLELLTKTHNLEINKLKAHLKKEEISRQAAVEQLLQKNKENEELMKICDELINGQSS